MRDTKPYTCVDCNLVGEQPRRGRRRLRCDLCRAEWVKARHAGTLVRTCLACGGSDLGKRRTYCSTACQPASDRLTYQEKRARQQARSCEACAMVYTPCHPAQRWCSQSCASPNKPRSTPRLTREEARERIRLSWQAKNRRRRAAKRGRPSEPYTLAEIAARDGFRCLLCGDAVPMDAKVPESLAPTIDHVVPISKGGDDTRANVQLAHFRCNSVKGPRDVQQLALIG